MRLHCAVALLLAAAAATAAFAPETASQLRGASAFAPGAPGAGGSAAAWDAVTKVLQDAVNDKAFPGAVAMVGDAHSVLYEAAVGRFTDGGHWPTVHDAPMTLDTVFDMASMTKVRQRTAVCMRHDAPVARLRCTAKFCLRWRSAGATHCRLSPARRLSRCCTRTDTLIWINGSLISGSWAPPSLLVARRT